MRYCSACGNGNDDGARFWLACGQQTPTTDLPVPERPTPATAPPRVYPPVQLRRTGGSLMAIAGLILGAISLVLAIAALAGSSIGYGEALIFIIAGLVVCVVSIHRNRSESTSAATTAGVACNGLALWLVVVGGVLAFLTSGSSSGDVPSAFEGTGYYVVGADIAPGTYRTTGAASHTNRGLCEYGGRRGLPSTTVAKFWFIK